MRLSRFERLAVIALVVVADRYFSELIAWGNWSYFWSLVLAAGTSALVVRFVEATAEAPEVRFKVGSCSRDFGHPGPCNGFPIIGCPAFDERKGA
jgi:hypothetical protein